MTIKQIRAMTGLSQQAFADKYSIPKRTLENWEMEGSAHRECPEYVKALLERVVTEDFRKVVKA